MKTSQIKLILVALASSLMATTACAEDKIIFTTGDVQIRDASGQLRPAMKGEPIYVGDTLVTAPGGYAQAKLDAGFMAIRPMSQVRLDAPQLSTDPRAGNLYQVTLQQGGVRMISGKEDAPKDGHRDLRASPRMSIVTPNANISLRDADGEAMIVPPKVIGAAPTTFSLVNNGEASVRSAGGALTVMPNQAVSVLGKALPDMVAITSLPTTLPIASSLALTPKKLTTTTTVQPVLPIAKQGTLVGMAMPTTIAPPLGKTGVLAPPPTLPSTLSPKIAMLPVIQSPLATLSPPLIQPPIVPVPLPVVKPLVFTPPPTLVLPPIVTPPPLVIKPPILVIAPPILVIRPPTLVCTTVIINGLKQQICK